ncbi:hypothetical protein [Streptomyces chattanoogensis]|uniref:hypothetical protein n=1 Tax=Streptomyces chattanoogensis TaxID=66876 RepID=UPI00316AE2F0
MQFGPPAATSAWWRLRAEHTDTGPGWYAEFGIRHLDGPRLWHARIDGRAHAQLMNAFVTALTV